MKEKIKEHHAFLTKRNVTALILAITLTTSIFYLLTAGYGAGDSYISTGSFVSSYSYLVSRVNSTHFDLQNGSDGTVAWTSTNDDAIIQAGIDNCTANGGLIFVRAATYSASVTVKNNTLLMFEYGVSGITYTTEATGIVLKYATSDGQGFVVFGAPLNMSGNEVQFGIFHSGATRPTSPAEAQWFYDTDDHALFVYNGTAWEDYSGIGAQGAQGERGLGGLGSYSLIVYQNGSNTEARWYNGTLLCRDTDDDDVINWALGNSTGITFLLGGTYSIGNTINQGKTDILKGSGVGNTKLDVTAGVNCITIDPSATDSTWGISDLQIDMNENSGHAIYCTHAADVSAWGTNNAYIRNVDIDYVKAGYAGIYLQDIYLMKFEQIVVTTKGTGIYIGHSEGDVMNWGNSVFDRIMIDMKENNCVGLDVDQGASQRSLTLTTFNHLHTFVSGGKTGCIGVRFDGGTEQRYTTFIDLIAENCNVSVYLNDCRDIVFINPKLLDSATYCVQLEGDTYGIQFKGGRMSGAYLDASTASGNNEKNLIDGTFLITNVQNGQWDWTQFVHGTVTYNDGGTYYTDSYETDTGSWTEPHGITWNGRIVAMYNGDQSPVFRTWCYIGGAWRYEEGAQGLQGVGGYGAYKYIVYVNGSNYQYRNWTGQLEATNADAETLIELAIAACDDYDKIWFAEGTYDLDDEIDDQGKNGIGIYGTWGSIFDVDNKDNTKHGFLLTNVDDWIFDGIAFEAVTVSDGSPGHESSAIEMQGTNDNIEIRYVRFNNVNGYSIRVEGEALGATYTTNLWIHHNHQDDAGHNFFSGSGVNYSRIENNWMNKSDEGLDSEHIWLAGNDVSGTDIWSCHNSITGNTMLGGSIAINVMEYDTDDPDSASHNIISDNNIFHPVNSTASNYPSIYVDTNNNQIVNNHIVDLRTGKTTSSINIIGDQEPRTSIICTLNYIWHVSGTGISAYNCAHNGSIITFNRIMGRYGDSYNSINFNDGSNDWCVIAFNVACGTINIGGNTNGYEAGNLEDVAD